jgi:hypothetical protein
VVHRPVQRLSMEFIVATPQIDLGLGAPCSQPHTSHYSRHTSYSLDPFISTAGANPRVHQVLLFHGNAKVQWPRPTRITNKSFGGMGLLPRLERWCLLPNRISHCLIRSPNTEKHRIGEIRAKLLLRGPRGSSTTRLGAPKRRTTSTFSL